MRPSYAKVSLEGGGNNSKQTFPARQLVDELRTRSGYLVGNGASFERGNFLSAIVPLATYETG
jgi:hypothetical protein